MKAVPHLHAKIKALVRRRELSDQIAKFAKESLEIYMERARIAKNVLLLTTLDIAQTAMAKAM